MSKVCDLCGWEIEEWQRSDRRAGFAVHGNPADHRATREPVVDNGCSHSVAVRVHGTDRWVCERCRETTADTFDPEPLTISEPETLTTVVTVSEPDPVEEPVVAAVTPEPPPITVTPDPEPPKYIIPPTREFRWRDLLGL